MGVDDVPSGPCAGCAGGAPGNERGACELRGAGRELEELDLQALDAAQRSHLIAHEAPALRVRLVGLHVGDHERAHDPVDRSALE